MRQIGQKRSKGQVQVQIKDSGVCSRAKTRLFGRAAQTIWENL